VGELKKKGNKQQMTQRKDADKPQEKKLRRKNQSLDRGGPLQPTGTKGLKVKRFDTESAGAKLNPLWEGGFIDRAFPDCEGRNTGEGDNNLFSRPRP